MARDGRTADDVEAELAVRGIPGGQRTWLDVAQEMARAEGAILADVCRPGCRPPPAAARAKHKTWLALRELGFSFPEIAKPWSADHTTVIAALRKLGVEAKPKTVRAHAWTRGGVTTYESVDRHRPVLADRAGHMLKIGALVDGRQYGGVVEVATEKLQREAA